MTDVFLDRLSYALGDEARSVDEEAARGCLFSTADVLKGIGFRQHYACLPETSAYDLAKRAVEKIRPYLDGVDAIVYASMFPISWEEAGERERRFRDTKDITHLMDFPAARLQSDFGLKRAQVIGLTQQACAGSLGAIQIGRALLVAEPEIRKVLCVAADRFPEGSAYERHYNFVSDAAGAFVLSRTPAGFRVLSCHAVVDGTLISKPESGSMGGLSYAQEAVQRTLAKAGLEMKDVRWIVGENTHPKIWQFLSRILGCRADQVCIPSLPEVGHAISVDTIINLQRLREEKKVGPGDRVLLFATGYGHIWQCTLLETLS